MHPCAKVLAVYLILLAATPYFTLEINSDDKTPVETDNTEKVNKNKEGEIVHADPDQTRKEPVDQDETSKTHSDSDETRTEHDDQDEASKKHADQDEVGKKHADSDETRKTDKYRYEPRNQDRTRDRGDQSLYDLEKPINDRLMDVDLLLDEYYPSSRQTLLDYDDDELIHDRKKTKAYNVKISKIQDNRHNGIDDSLEIPGLDGTNGHGVNRQLKVISKLQKDILHILNKLEHSNSKKCNIEDLSNQLGSLADMLSSIDPSLFETSAKRKKRTSRRYMTRGMFQAPSAESFDYEDFIDGLREEVMFPDYNPAPSTQLCSVMMKDLRRKIRILTNILMGNMHRKQKVFEVDEEELDKLSQLEPVDFFDDSGNIPEMERLTPKAKLSYNIEDEQSLSNFPKFSSALEDLMSERELENFNIESPAKVKPSIYGTDLEEMHLPGINRDKYDETDLSTDYEKLLLDAYKKKHSSLDDLKMSELPDLEGLIKTKPLLRRRPRNRNKHTSAGRQKNLEVTGHVDIERCDKCEDRGEEEVCGINGQTYETLCHAINCAGLTLKDITIGGCVTKDVCAEVECDYDDEVCLPLVHGTCLAIYSKDGTRFPCHHHICIDLDNCEDGIFLAVCGVDGNTYDSLCKLHKANVHLAYTGTCRPNLCKEQVCGTDHNTYTSACHAHARNIRVDYAGKCFPVMSPDSTESRCTVIRKSGRCKKQTLCRNAVLPVEACCPICGGTMQTQLSSVALADFIASNPDNNHLYVLENLLRDMLSTNAARKCQLFGYLTRFGNLSIVLEAVNPGDHQICSEALIKLRKSIHNGTFLDIPKFKVAYNVFDPASYIKDKIVGVQDKVINSPKTINKAVQSKLDESLLEVEDVVDKNFEDNNSGTSIVHPSSAVSVLIHLTVYICHAKLLILS